MKSDLAAVASPDRSAEAPGDLAPRIVAIVRAFLVKRGADRPIGPEEDLREAGLTSVDMVNLMLALESAFAVLIPEAKMLPENFQSVRAIEGLIEELGRA